jgi:hypothetical protein
LIRPGAGSQVPGSFSATKSSKKSWAVGPPWRSLQIHSDHSAKPSCSQMSGPPAQGHGVAEPLVRELVDERRLVGHEREVGLGLALERVADVGRVVDDRAGRVERVRAVERAEEAHDVGHLVEQRPELRGERRVDRVVDRDVADARLGQREAALGRGGEVGGHRVALVPDPGRASAVGEAPREDAVAHGGDAVGHRDGLVEGRLVPRVVVGGEPARRPLRLTHDEGAVGGRDPALDRLVGVGDDRWHARVAHDHGEVAALPQPVARRDDQLLARAPVGGRASVDQQQADVEAAQVEIEARQGLRGARGDDGRAVEPAARAVVVQGQAIVGDVVAAVAGELEERIAEPRRPDVGARGRRPESQDRRHLTASPRGNEAASSSSGACAGAWGRSCPAARWQDDR